MGIYTGTETDKPFVDAFNKLTYRWNPWEVWNDFVIMFSCACGAGATLIAGIHEIRRKLEKEKLNYQNHVLFTAQDIDSTVALMCYIQLSLLGVAGFVKIGNSLTEPMCSGDSLENYWFTPMYFSEVWTFRRIFRGYLFEKGGDT